jgi:hypothetical protein
LEEHDGGASVRLLRRARKDEGQHEITFGVDGDRIAAQGGSVQVIEKQCRQSGFVVVAERCLPPLRRRARLRGGGSFFSPPPFFSPPLLLPSDTVAVGW